MVFSGVFLFLAGGAVLFLLALVLLVFFLKR